MKHHIIAHHPCQDGMLAATICRRALFDNSIAESDIIYHPAKYPMKVPTNIFSDDIVYVLDFSLPPADMERIANNCKKLVWIDHHDSAIKAWDQWRAKGNETPNNMTIVLSGKRCGAWLTWEFFNGEGPPLVVHYVDDRDRWVWALNGTKEICAYGYSLPFEFVHYEQWINDAKDSSLVREMMSAGRAINRTDDQKVQQMLNHAVEFNLNIGNAETLRVVACNVPYFMASDMGHTLLDEHPQADFALTYMNAAKGKTFFSLRGRKDGTNVSLIAKHFGGGGHTAAAGFELATNRVGIVFPALANTVAPRFFWHGDDPRDDSTAASVGVSDV